MSKDVLSLKSPSATGQSIQVKIRSYRSIFIFKRLYCLLVMPSLFLATFMGLPRPLLSVLRMSIIALASVFVVVSLVGSGFWLGLMTMPKPEEITRMGPVRTTRAEISSLSGANPLHANNLNAARFQKLQQEAHSPWLKPRSRW
jgi:hypothetical protein